MTEGREFTCNLRETRMKKNVIEVVEKTEKRRDALEDKEEKKMNVGRRNANEKPREHAERRGRCKGKRNEDETSRNAVRNEGVTKPSEKWRKCGETIGVVGIASKMKI